MAQKNTTKKVIRRYLKELTSELTCSRSMKCAFAGQMKNELLQFAKEHEDISVEDLYREFGTPEEVSGGFYDRKDYEKLLKKTKRIATIWKIIGIVLFILFIIFVIYFAGIINSSNGTYYITEPKQLVGLY